MRFEVTRYRLDPLPMPHDRWRNVWRDRVRELWHLRGSECRGDRADIRSAHTKPVIGVRSRDRDERLHDVESIHRRTSIGKARDATLGEVSCVSEMRDAAGEQ